MQISTIYNQNSQYLQENSNIGKISATVSFADTLKTQSASYSVEIKPTLYTQEKPLFTDYFQSAGRAMKNQTSFDETWINPDDIRKSVPQKGAYVDNVADEDVPRDSIGRKFIDMLPQSYFDNMTHEEEMRYREIMEDSHISYSEIDSLSFEQVSKFDFSTAATALLQEGYGTDEIPLFSQDTRVAEFFSATTFTPDDTFNRAIFKTVKEATNVTSAQIASGLSQLKYHLLQKHFNEEFKGAMIGGSFKGNIENPFFLEKDNIHTNYDELINQALNYYGEGASKPQTTKNIEEQYKVQYEWYFTLRENYDNEKSKAKTIE